VNLQRTITGASADKKNKRAFAEKLPSVNRAGPRFPGLRPPTGCALTPFEPCTQTMHFCRENRVLFCDQKLGFLTLEDDCNPNRTCHAYSETRAWCY